MKPSITALPGLLRQWWIEHSFVALFITTACAPMFGFLGGAMYLGAFDSVPRMFPLEESEIAHARLVFYTATGLDIGPINY